MASTEPQPQMQAQAQAESLLPPKQQSEPLSQPAPKLPKLSPSEFKAFNRLAEHMDYFVRLDHDCVVLIC